MSNIKRIWEHVSPAVWMAVGATANWFTNSSLWESSYNAFAKWIGIAVEASQRQNTQAIIAIAVDVIGFIPLCIVACRRSFIAIKTAEVRTRCFEYIRKNMALMLSNCRGTEKEVQAADLSIRVFRRKGHKLSFNDIDGCYANNIRKKIKFDIEKDEGLVSKAYKTKLPQYEINNVTDERYHLSPENRSVVNDLKFIVAVPILKKNSVVAVISVDSTRKICKTDQDIQSIITYSQVLAYDLFDLISSKEDD